MHTSLEIKVRGYHLDFYGHVNNARYLEFLEEARWDYLDKTHVSINDFAKKGFHFAVVNINISYKYPARLYDVLVIQTQMEKIGTKSMTMDQKIFLKNSDELVVDAAVTFVVIDSKTQKALPIEGEVKNMFYISSGGSSGVKVSS